MKRREPRQRQRRHLDRQLKSTRIDPYRPRKKDAGGAVCKDCGATYERGRWSWGEPLAGARRRTCPACRRGAEHNPAGVVRLSGAFFSANRHEVLRLVRNEEAREKAQHPLQRILAIRRAGPVTELAIADVHLARRIGDAVHAAYQGELQVKYSPGEYRVRVDWKRA